MLLNRDRRYVTGFDPIQFGGFAKLHYLELDLGTGYAGGPLRLLMQGFIEYFTATSVFAAHQAGIEAIVPFLDVQTPDGRWVRAIDDIGFPAGLARTSVADLTGKVPAGTSRIRIGTNLKIYWDQILIDTTPQTGAFELHDVPLMEASLRFLGFPRQIEGNPASDLSYDYGQVSTTGPFTRHAGYYTAYGDVRTIVNAAMIGSRLSAPAMRSRWSSTLRRCPRCGQDGRGTTSSMPMVLRRTWTSMRRCPTPSNPCRSIRWASIPMDRKRSIPPTRCIRTIASTPTRDGSAVERPDHSVSGIPNEQNSFIPNADGMLHSVRVLFRSRPRFVIHRLTRASTRLPRGRRRRSKPPAQFDVFHEFRFDDRLAASGISFVHRIVDDAGLNYKAVHYDHGNGLAVADIDGDGLTDIYFVNQAGPSELWKNLGSGRFQNFTSEAGLAVPGRIAVAASFADVDNDGDEDLFVTTVRGGNLLFENDGRGRFHDVTAESSVGLSSHSSGSVFFDYNKDGLLDLLVCNVGRYTSDAKGAHGEYVGLPDAFSGHMYPERSEHPVLYQNLGGHRFKDVTAAVKLQPEGWCGDASVADLNQDGWPDVYFLNMMGANHYFENQQGRTFVEKTKAYFPRTSWGAMGIKFFDYDNDGRLDLFVTDMHSDMSENVGPELETRKGQAPG